MPYVHNNLREPFATDLCFLINRARASDGVSRDSDLVKVIHSIVEQTFHGPVYFEKAADIAVLIREMPNYSWDGQSNYVVSELVGLSMRPDTGWRYHTLHRAYGIFLAAGLKYAVKHAGQEDTPTFIRAHGVFSAAAAEFYRRLIAPYEDKAIENNGDIAAYIRPQEETGNESADNKGLDQRMR